MWAGLTLIELNTELVHSRLSTDAHAALTSLGGSTNNQITATLYFSYLYFVYFSYTCCSDLPCSFNSHLRPTLYFWIFGISSLSIIWAVWIKKLEHLKFMTNLFRNCFRCRLWTILEFIAGSKHLNKKGNAMQYFILNIWAQLNTNTNTNTKHPSPPISSVHVPNFWISWSYRFFALSHPADFAPWWGFSIVRKVLCLAHPWYTSSECDWTTEVSLIIGTNMRFQFWTWVHGINDSTLKGREWLNKLAKLRRHASRVHFG